MAVGITVTTAPSLAVWAASDIRARLRADSTLDTTITQLIAEATGKVERDLGRALLTQTITQVQDGWADNGYSSLSPLQSHQAGLDASTAAAVGFIPLLRNPVQSVTSVAYLDSDGNSQTVSTSVYRLVSGQEPAKLTAKPGQVWPSALAPGPGTVTIVYVAGWTAAASVPAALRSAVVGLVGHWLEHPEAVLAGTITSEVPLGYEDLIAPFRYSEFN